MVTAPLISGVDHATDSHQPLRREIKYVFRKHDVSTLRRVLQHSCRPITHAGPVSTVRSIYLDDANLASCRAGIDGVGIRHKTRVRWYDAERPGDHFYFELKWRRHRHCGKDRLRVPCTPDLAAGPVRALRAHLERHLPDRYRAILAHETDAVTLVEYKREHFALRHGDARLTLDYDLRFYPGRGLRTPALRFAERVPGVALIECKIPIDGTKSPLDALHGALRPLRARPERFSKYVAACHRLGYARVT